MAMHVLSDVMLEGGLKPSGGKNLGGEGIEKRFKRLRILDPYRKPPQVGEARSLRCTREPWLRNSAKQLDVSSQDVFPDVSSGRSKRSQMTVYQKHRSLLNRKVMYRG